MYPFSSFKFLPISLYMDPSFFYIILPPALHMNLFSNLFFFPSSSFYFFFFTLTVPSYISAFRFFPIFQLDLNISLYVCLFMFSSFLFLWVFMSVLSRYVCLFIFCEATQLYICKLYVSVSCIFHLLPYVSMPCTNTVCMSGLPGYWLACTSCISVYLYVYMSCKSVCWYALYICLHSRICECLHILYIFLLVSIFPINLYGCISVHSIWLMTYPVYYMCLLVFPVCSIYTSACPYICIVPFYKPVRVHIRIQYLNVDISRMSVC
jgi:hypothetical protein